MPRTRPTSRRRKLLLALVVTGLPIAILLGIESVLRLAGYGGHTPAVRPVADVPGGRLILVDNAGAAEFFFNNPDHPGTLNEQAFVDPKPRGVVRILLVGGSAIKGFPQPPALNAGAFLEAMLEDAWPGRDVEIVNLGCTAVASFPAMRLCEQTLRYDPDLVIVYSGHNEFFGALGVASLNRAAATPAMMRLQYWLRATGTGDAMASLFRPRAGQPKQTLMETMVGQSYTAPDSPLRAAAARNLRTHLTHIARACAARHVPVILCTLPSNERDLAPLGEPSLDGLGLERAREVTDTMSRAWAMDAGPPTDAEKAMRAILADLPDHARAEFFLGRALLAQGRDKEARESFARALDEDPMPWRTPESSNQAIVDAARDSGALLCDVRAFFRERSPGGAVGWELMDDHVHPSLAGQGALARAIVGTMTSLTGDLRVDPARFESLPDGDAYATRLGANAYDAYGSAHLMRVLGEIPFIKTSNPELFARTNRACNNLAAAMPMDVRGECIKWQSPEMHRGARRPITAMVARVLLREQKYEEAERLYDLAARSTPAYSSWNLEYTYFALACRERLGGLNEDDHARATGAIARGRALLADGPSVAGDVERHMGRLHQLRGEWDEAVPLLTVARGPAQGADLWAIDQALVMSYVKLRRLGEARSLIDRGIARGGEDAAFYSRLGAALDNLERTLEERGIPAESPPPGEGPP